MVTLASVAREREDIALIRATVLEVSKEDLLDDCLSKISNISLECVRPAKAEYK